MRAGQRVKFVRRIGPAGGELVGQEGIILHRWTWADSICSDYRWDWVVDFHALGCHDVNCHEPELEPITDPGADAFLERIRKLKPYEEPKVDVDVSENEYDRATRMVADDRLPSISEIRRITENTTP